MELNIIWFILIAVLLTGYVILDGFDLGIGFVSFFAKNDTDKRILLNSIAPVWDGNEVWLLTGGGALFAAFPDVYATIFSGFYMALMLVLAMLIFRATALEFRSKSENPTWRKIFDNLFAISSTIAALLFGVALGNVANGIYLDANKEYVGTFWHLLNPYSLVVGLTGLALIIVHGFNYAFYRTENELQKLLKSKYNIFYYLYFALFVILNLFTIIAKPHLLQNYNSNPVLYLLPLVNLIVILLMYKYHKSNFHLKTFFMSSLSILLNMLTFAIAMFPNFAYSLTDPKLNLTIYNSASSQKTLTVMLIIALIGMPLVITYTIVVYRIFRGKTVLNENSY
jgi:cytochrome d ubiquinol oxidase subunit II